MHEELLKDNLSGLLLMGITAMIVLVVAIVLFVLFYQKKIISIHQQKEKELTEAAIQAEEEERGRIAAELHDDVGAMLASVRLYLHLADKQGSGSEAFSQSHQLIDETISKVRNMSRRLQPAMLQHLGLGKALQAFFDVFTKSGVIMIHYTDTELPQLTENTALAIYRIVQELVNNTLKHARATEIWIEQDANGDGLSFRFTHNGEGITEARFQEYIYKKDATGLKNIINRLKVINGSIHFENDEKLYHTILNIPV